MKRDKLPAGATQRARSLRRNATDAEKALWYALRQAIPQAKFRRQVPIGRYIADFASHSAKLIVEVDGGQHGEQAGYDAARTQFLESEGYRVIRFWNNDVLANTDGVVEQISLSLREREGAPKARKGEGENPSSASPSPSHVAARRGPLPLPAGEERMESL